MKAGNDGMVRVCARRAAGVAIRFWQQTHNRNGWGFEAMSQLRNLASDATMPQAVREAATRLSARVNEQFASPHSTNPIEDSEVIINHLLDSL